MRKKIINVFCVFFVMCLCLVGIIGYKHEKKQDSLIESLYTEINFLKNQTDIGSKYYYEPNNYNYLAIGNSITWHGICDYWWAYRGMAASTTDKDYYHRVLSYIENNIGTSSSYVTNFNVWESLSHDRAETLVALDPYLDAKIDLVTVQLGENVSDLDTYESDFEYLITYIKSKAPEAQIIIVDDFWYYPGREKIKSKIASRLNCDFVDLKKIRQNEKYMCGKNTIIYDDLSVEHIVEHNGVAKHPNDLAMEYIAEGIIEHIRIE